MTQFKRGISASLNAGDVNRRIFPQRCSKAIAMSTALKILVPVKRVIDYTVRFPF